MAGSGTHSLHTLLPTASFNDDVHHSNPLGGYPLRAYGSGRQLLPIAHSASSLDAFDGIWLYRGCVPPAQGCLCHSTRPRTDGLEGLRLICRSFVLYLLNL
ncbi:uncharacterized protein MYCGRDRAFT_106236 [Zymoseptoria tritici IPO323]|uniref:Uncharacterized protein n=1 Tax=Zymoseptoria tritici (strain CBS 115943 / IPO323) TaxID=336722 RepID=F9XMB6_ZYMTI|nr:uncharacterized protein MYCGRDRAFT_106236 [Zymoseptoria tritici IPO323]EGP83452.1 hypothetical protein MYCGRDRAFT_106236 [Zymoseptoria tritici IPO323]